MTGLNYHDLVNTMGHCHVLREGTTGGRVCAEWMAAPADVNQAYHVDLSLIVKNRE